MHQTGIPKHTHARARAHTRTYVRTHARTHKERVRSLSQLLMAVQSHGFHLQACKSLKLAHHHICNEWAHVKSISMHFGAHCQWQDWRLHHGTANYSTPHISHHAVIWEAASEQEEMCQVSAKGGKWAHTCASCFCTNFRGAVKPGWQKPCFIAY